MLEAVRRTQRRCLILVLVLVSVLVPVLVFVLVLVLIRGHGLDQGRGIGQGRGLGTGTWTRTWGQGCGQGQGEHKAPLEKLLRGTDMRNAAGRRTQPDICVRNLIFCDVNFFGHPRFGHALLYI